MAGRMFVLAAGAAAGYLLAVRPWQLRWGATDEEVAAVMAGDDIVLDPQIHATRAISIRATPERVWPSLVLMGGYGRATRMSGELPELTDLKPGDLWAGLPDNRDITVERIEAPNLLVLAIREPDITVSYSIALHPAGGRTRLVARTRVRAQPSLRGTAYLVMTDLGDFALARRQLLTIRSRAESEFASQ